MIDHIRQKRQEIEEMLQEASAKLMALWPQQTAESILHVEKKPDDTLVSEADYASNAILTSGLQRLFPDIPVKSEESGAADKLSEHYWLIDPLDGTYRFVEGHEDFAILVAYIGEGGVSLAGWMVFPARNTLFWAIGDQVGGHSPHLSRESSMKKQSGYVRCGIPEDTLQKQEASVNTEGFHSGEAFCRFFTGRLSALVLQMGRLGPWDVAAPAAIISALGGVVMTAAGSQYLFGKENEKCFIATTEALRKDIPQLIARL